MQIVRYTPGQFYSIHPDYYEPAFNPDFDFQCGTGGSNRFATVFLYLNDVEEGGFTVFPGGERLTPAEPVPQHALDMFSEGSTEREVLAMCHSKLAIQPKKGRAVLFYSTTPEGELDERSAHGACPVIKGIKYGANTWVWCRQRYEFAMRDRVLQQEWEQEQAGGQQQKQQQQQQEQASQDPIVVYFINDTTEKVELLFEDQVKSTLPPDGDAGWQTFPGQIWWARYKGKLDTIWRFKAAPEHDKSWQSITATKLAAAEEEPDQVKDYL